MNLHNILDLTPAQPASGNRRQGQRYLDAVPA